VKCLNLFFKVAIYTLIVDGAYMLSNLLKKMLNSFQSISKDEIKKFTFLAFIFIFTIGIYWFLRTSKDGVFNTIVGYDFQPWAKWVSMLFIIPLTSFYGFLVDKFPRHRIFYALSVLYSIGALIFTLLLSNKSYGIDNVDASPWRMLGWAYYVFVESFGSIMVVLFWTFAADTTEPEVAKRWFPFLSFAAQFGALFGSAVNAGRFGHYSITSTLLICSAVIFMIPIMIFIFMHVIPQNQLKSYRGSEKGEKENKKGKIGFFEGFRLVFSQPYLLGIFFSIMIYEIVTTLFDFRFKAMVGEEVARQVSADVVPLHEVGALKTQIFNEWVGWMGEWTALLAIVSYIFGIGKITQKLGLSVSLVVLPVLLGVVGLLLVGAKSLTIAAVAVVIAKGINYALYQPSKEQLYIPTSKDAKYKSKAFVEMFGSRTSKAAGSLINAMKARFPLIFPLISLGSTLSLCFIWFFISLYLARRYDDAVKHEKVVC